MNVDFLRKGKMAINVLWVVLALSLVMPSGALATILHGLLALMLVAHVIEFAVFSRTLAKLGGSMGHHFVQVLLYGVFHIQLVKLEAEPAAAD